MWPQQAVHSSDPRPLVYVSVQGTQAILVESRPPCQHTPAPRWVSVLPHLVSWPPGVTLLMMQEGPRGTQGRPPD